MDIEMIEKVLTNLYADFKDVPPEKSGDVFGFMACQLLLHIYRKLEDIDGDLRSIYSQLTEMEQALPGKW